MAIYGSLNDRIFVLAIGEKICLQGKINLHKNDYISSLCHSGNHSLDEILVTPFSRFIECDSSLLLSTTSEVKEIDQLIYRKIV